MSEFAYKLYLLVVTLFSSFSPEAIKEAVTQTRATQSQESQVKAAQEEASPTQAIDSKGAVFRYYTNLFGAACDARRMIAEGHGVELSYDKAMGLPVLRWK